MVTAIYLFYSAMTSYIDAYESNARKLIRLKKTWITTIKTKIIES